MVSSPRARRASSSRRADVQLLNSTPVEDKKALGRTCHHLRDQTHRLVDEKNEAVAEARALGRRVAELEALLAHEKARGDHEKARADGLEEEAAMAAAMASLPDESIDTVRVFLCVAR
jgi:peptidoglycan hydrolase CwlO-like protein